MCETRESEWEGGKGSIANGGGIHVQGRRAGGVAQQGTEDRVTVWMGR